MIISFITSGLKTKVVIRKEVNLYDRCVDIVDRPNTLPFLIHTVKKDNKILVSLSQFADDSKELDIVEQEWFKVSELCEVKDYINELAKKVLDASTFI